MDIAEVYFLKNFVSFRTLEPVQVYYRFPVHTQGQEIQARSEKACLSFKDSLTSVWHCSRSLIPDLISILSSVDPRYLAASLNGRNKRKLWCVYFREHLTESMGFSMLLSSSLTPAWSPHPDNWANIRGNKKHYGNFK